MRKFMDDDFLLHSDVAKRLYHDIASKMPIIDYHCHIDPKEIYEDVQFDNITQVWLGGDHYKWRQMRSNGIDEKYITGDASDREKFQKWAETLEKAIGNPLYHWSHLELKRYFGYEGHLCGETAQEVWDLCNQRLQKKDLSVRGIIRQSNVEVICTTDDPIDDLRWHHMLAEDDSFDVKVLPAWRPDKAMNIDKNDYVDYLRKLEAVSQIKLDSFKSLMDALRLRMDHFEKLGCKVSDHGLDYVCFVEASEEEIESVFQKRLMGEELSLNEISAYKTAFMCALAKEYDKRGWVMQLHYGAARNLNQKMFEKLGPDTGYDAISTYAPSSQLASYLNALAYDNCLPKTILYSLNPNDNAMIGSLIGCFQDGSAAGKIQQGSAWWFNDHKTGMTEQMTSLANLGLLGNFIGMLTDSRSFLSYTRHEYFRRILCDLVGTWVENGEYPDDEKALEKIIKGICYENCKHYFNF